MTQIYIDTNIFLDFYQTAKNRMATFHDLVARADSIVVPEQTMREFRRNREATLIRLAEEVNKSFITDLQTTAIVHDMPEFKQWLTARDATKKEAKAIEAQLRKWAKDETSDPVYQQFEKLYCKGTTMMTPEGALARAHERKLLGNPPTSPDKYTVGDEIIWETLLALCTDDLIVVSGDRTFLKNENTLRREFNAQGNRHLVLVTKSPSEALEQVGRPSKEITEAENVITSIHKLGVCTCPEGADLTEWIPNGRCNCLAACPLCI